MACSPPEQFAIIPLIPIHIGNLYSPSTNSSLFMPPTLSLVLLLVYFVTPNGGHLVLNAWQLFVEMIYDFVFNLVNEQISGPSLVKQRFFLSIFVTFTCLPFRNFIGMIPYSFTVTSHFSFTLGLPFSPSSGTTLPGFQIHGLHFFSFFLPRGVALPLAPFLVMLEPFPHSLRALSLGIRLSANMMAGHSSVKISSGFARTMLSMGGIMYLAHLAPLLVVFASTGLELGVGVSQAHVPTTPNRTYLNDAINLH
uniref:ATP synthase subunit a n=1 Tax=Nothoceros aenigmaticus TaxID=13813 RepID=C3RYP7_9EMBR|nr:ATP synthase F0 subunit 6 [Nothoceros aenigmaticus]ACC86803.1 ATP synthase F0 subunit 6 [Nothoceros aenigmaticus]